MRRFASVFKRKPNDAAQTTSPLSTPPLSIDNHSSASSSTTESIDSPTRVPKWKVWLTPKKPVAVTKSSSHRTPAQQQPLPVHHHHHDDDSDVLDVEKNVEIRIRNALVVPTHVSPFAHALSGPIYPRSVNKVLSSPSPSLRIQVLRRRLLNHLPDQDLASIFPLATHPAQRPIAPTDDANARHPRSLRIHSASPGLRRWITRLCFEERYVVHIATPVGIETRPISAVHAIPALEYSEALDILVNPDLDPTPPISSHAVDLPAPAHKTTAPTSASAPSPLRVEHSTHPPKATPEIKPVVKVKSDVKRIVRFAEDDEDDGVPLHILRMKKKREEKAEFLRMEQVRREQQVRTERQRAEEERRRLEQESAERERKRIQKEREKQERDQVLYAETIIQQRLRREAQRAGGVPALSNMNPNSLSVPSSPSMTSLRDSERHRPESRRSATMPIPRPDLMGDSPSSSRPPSLAYSPVSPATFGPSSRPPSLYSSSSEDIRHTRNYSAVASVPLQQPMIVGYPTWSGSNPNLAYIPPVPAFPNFMMQDMPLLPPTAPFMKSYDRRSSRGSSVGHSSNSSSRRGSVNSSTERLNVMPASPPSPSPSPSSSPMRSDRRPGHQRQGSGDSKGTSRTTQSSSRQRPPSSFPQTPRGRQPPSQYSQTSPSPWTALPTQSGTLPQAMPVSPYTHHSLPRTQRGTKRAVPIS